MSAAEPPVVKDTRSSYLPLASLYFVTVGLLYLWGYWSTFHVNILQYIGIADVLKMTLFPIASAAGALLVGIVLGEMLFLSTHDGSRVGSAIQGGLRFLFPYLEALYLPVTMVILFLPGIWKWNIVALLFGFPFYVIAKRGGFLESMLPNDSVRSSVIFLLTTMPTFAYSIGLHQAAAILDGNNYKYLVADTVEGIVVGNPDNPFTRVKYLGQAGDQSFLLLPDNETVFIVSFQMTKGLQVRNYRKPREDAKEELKTPAQSAPASTPADVAPIR